MVFVVSPDRNAVKWNCRIDPAEIQPDAAGCEELSGGGNFIRCCWIRVKLLLTCFLTGAFQKILELWTRCTVVIERSCIICIVVNFSIFDCNSGAAVNVQSTTRYCLIFKNQTCSAIIFILSFINIALINTDSPLDCQYSCSSYWSRSYRGTAHICICFPEIKAASASDVICSHIECNLQRSRIFRNRDAVQRKIHTWIRINTAAESACRIFCSITCTSRFVPANNHGILGIVGFVINP